MLKELKALLLFLQFILYFYSRLLDYSFSHLHICLKLKIRKRLPTNKFKDIAGTTDLQKACLSATDKNNKYPTSIRIYGDKTWNGKAWDK